MGCNSDNIRLQFDAILHCLKINWTFTPDELIWCRGGQKEDRSLKRIRSGVQSVPELTHWGSVLAYLGLLQSKINVPYIGCDFTSRYLMCVRYREVETASVGKWPWGASTSIQPPAQPLSVRLSPGKASFSWARTVWSEMHAGLVAAMQAQKWAWKTTVTWHVHSEQQQQPY